MIRRIVLGCMLVVAIAAIAFAVLAWHPSIYPIAPPAASSIDPGLIRRGAHLAALGYCDSCHTADRDRAYAVNRHRTRTPLNSVLSPCCDKKIPHLDGVPIGAERDPVSEANVRGFTAC